MTNELGTTLQDIEAKAERKREVKLSLLNMYVNTISIDAGNDYETIRKYIEEN